MSIYHHYGANRPPIQRPSPTTMAEVQAQIDGFLRKHPIPEDLEKTKRIDAILWDRKYRKCNT